MKVESMKDLLSFSYNLLVACKFLFSMSWLSVKKRFGKIKRMNEQIMNCNLRDFVII